jgi:hypothetical protein
MLFVEWINLQSYTRSPNAGSHVVIEGILTSGISLKNVSVVPLCQFHIESRKARWRGQFVITLV